MKPISGWTYLNIAKHTVLSNLELSDRVGTDVNSKSTADPQKRRARAQFNQQYRRNAKHAGQLRTSPRVAPMLHGAAGSIL